MMDPGKEKRENTELEQQSTNINEGRVQREKEAENHEDPGFKNVLLYSSAYIHILHILLQFWVIHLDL